MTEQIGVNGNPVSLTAACDICQEPNLLCGPVELIEGEWICVSCENMIAEHDCPVCGENRAEVAPHECHICHNCQAERGDDDRLIQYR
jgi:hypothetical protein